MKLIVKRLGNVIEAGGYLLFIASCAVLATVLLGGIDFAVNLGIPFLFAIYGALLLRLGRFCSRTAS